MFIYIWEDVDPVTNRYHQGGGVAVIAQDLDGAAAVLINEGIGFYQRKPVPPDHTYELMNNEAPRVIVFPDSGCC